MVYHVDITCFMSSVIAQLKMDKKSCLTTYAYHVFNLFGSLNEEMW